MRRYRGEANQTDLTNMIPCPYCNKDMVIGRWHACKSLLRATEYINGTSGIRLLWTLDNGWRSYDLYEGDVIEDLTFAMVFNSVTQDNDYVAIDPTGE